MAKIKKSEILVPVRDFNCLKAAIRFGADAVYLGGEQFGMRSSAANFNESLLKKAVKLAHFNGVKTYLTCNNLLRDSELKDLPNFILFANEIGIDALIVADVGVLMLAKKIAPNLAIHISTQAGVVNHIAANAFYELGAKRVILARELSLEEIRQIRLKTPKDLEIEVFVHGAMCVSFSGRCLISQYLLNRDANRGQCAQPCRWKFHLMEETRQNQFFPIVENSEGSFILNSKDLCLIEHLDALNECGVDCFKIEGRAKSEYYTAVVANAYHLANEILEEKKLNSEKFEIPEWIKQELTKISYRGYCKGFLFGNLNDNINYCDGGYVRNYIVVAIVKKADGVNIFCCQKNKFNSGDFVEIVQPNQKPIVFKVEKMFDEFFEEIESVPHANMKFIIKSNLKIKPGSFIRKKIED